MATTAIVAEILIVGVGAGAWLWLALAALFGRGVVPVQGIVDAGALGVLLTVACAYVLGVVVDRIADSLHVGARVGFVRSAARARADEIAEMRLRMMSLDDGRARFLEYQRSRWRVARATLFNLACTVPASIFFITRQTGIGRGDAVKIEAVLLTALIVTRYAARRIHTAYVDRLGDSYRMWQEDAGRTEGT